MINHSSSKFESFSLRYVGKVTRRFVEHLRITSSRRAVVRPNCATGITIVSGRLYLSLTVK